MHSNLAGRIRNTHLTPANALLPLFEAIVNSIDALEDAKRPPTEARLEINIERPSTLRLPEDNGIDQRQRRPILGFEIIDNGIGFTDSNFRAFNEADTDRKAHKGGKGVGRFSWLKAFGEAKIRSVYEEDGQRLQRSFVFSTAHPNGINGGDEAPAGDDEPVETSVHLAHFRDEYERQVPRSAHNIAARIVEHCLVFFFYSRVPEHAILRDRDGEVEEVINLWDVYSRLVDEASSRAEFDIDGHPFQLTHFFVQASSHMKHQVNYCAHERVVESQNLVPTPATSKIPNLPGSLDPHGDGGQLVYVGYVSAKYLDQAVNPQRTGFNSWPQGGLKLPGNLSTGQIEDGVLTQVRDFLAPHTAAAKEEKMIDIRAHAYTESPQFRVIVEKYEDRLDHIPPGLSPAQLDVELYKVKRQLEIEVIERGEQLLREDDFVVDGQTIDEAAGEFVEWWHSIDDLGKASLAEYIVHRRRILNWLERAMATDKAGKYPKERVFHEIIFPLRSDSDEVSYERHNLWVLDEKLSYHQYLASDKPLRTIKGASVNGDDRPDVAVFYDRPIAVVEGEGPYSSVDIFEFKRPMRKEYSEKDNPILQVYSYINKLREGKAMRANGRPVALLNDPQFYCHIVADLSPKLLEIATHHSFKRTPDGQALFFFHDAYRAFVEISPFDRLLRDANKRNKILFDKLHLPSHVAYEAATK